MKTLRTGLVQLGAGGDVAANLIAARRLADGLPPCDLIVFPEVLAIRGLDPDYRAQAERVPGPVTGFMAALARERGAWVAGGVAERAGKRVFNTCIVLDRRGGLAAKYRKIHLFEATLDTGHVVRESNAFDPGSRPVTVDIEGWRFGLSICYDLRFPELFRRYAAAGAHAFLAPSNFTQRTGRDHWEVLVRARAIENQCYILAPNQCGTNDKTGVVSHGHSMAVDPWGKVLARAADAPRAIVAELDPAHLRAVRRHVPVLKHRRLR